MANTEMLVIKRGYDFSKWLLQHTGKFPKSYVSASPPNWKMGQSIRRANGHSPLQNSIYSATATKFFCVLINKTPSESAGVAMQISAIGFSASSLNSGPA